MYSIWKDNSFVVVSRQGDLVDILCEDSLCAISSCAIVIHLPQWAKVFIRSGRIIRLSSPAEKVMKTSWRHLLFTFEWQLCVWSQGLPRHAVLGLPRCAVLLLSKGVTVEGCLGAQRCLISPQSFEQLVSVCRSCQGQFVWLGCMFLERLCSVSV